MEGKKLNAGCGSNILKGWVNLDIFKAPGVDKVHNLEVKPWPFDKNTFSMVLMDNVLEHLENPLEIGEEIFRILENQGIWDFRVPYFTSVGAYQDPTHKHYFSEQVWKYFVDNPYNKKFTFSLKSVKFIYNRPFRYLPFRNLFRYAFNNVVRELQIQIVAEKK
tara:strand:- start:3974 stop:4462 length:489 start_codon:yes stop_codon:yes gene_type:complete